MKRLTFALLFLCLPAFAKDRACKECKWQEGKLIDSASKSSESHVFTLNNGASSLPIYRDDSTYTYIIDAGDRLYVGYRYEPLSVTINAPIKFTLTKDKKKKADILGIIDENQKVQWLWLSKKILKEPVTRND